MPSNPPPLSPEVAYLQSLGVVWLEEHATINIPKIPGNTQSTILVFLGIQVDDKTYQSTFNLQLSLGALVNEMIPLICYISSLPEYLWVFNIIREYGQADKKHLESGLLPQLLYALMLEKPMSYAIDVTAVQFAKGRLF